MAVSVFDHPLTGVLFGGSAAERWFSVEAEIAALLTFEAALAEVQGALGVISTASAGRIVAAITHARPDPARLALAMAADGVLIPGLLAQLRPLLTEEDRPCLHFGATSQDAMDSALMLRLRGALTAAREAIARLESAIDGLVNRFGNRELMGYTRMQAALPITVRHRLSVWRDPLTRISGALARHCDGDCAVQLGGAVGDLSALADKGPAVRAALARRLGLADAEPWHAARDRIGSIGSTLAQLSGACGKIGIDVALMARDSGEMSLSGGGSSSAMAHKQNPVTAEILVTLGHYAAAQSGLLTQSMMGEMERSGSAWSLEWMVLPSLVASALASADKATQLLHAINSIGSD